MAAPERGRFPGERFDLAKILRSPRSAGATIHEPPTQGTLERFPITWDHVIEQEPLKIKELEHVLIE
jgi:hypothetical protein